MLSFTGCLKPGRLVRMWKNKSEEKLGLKEAKMPKKPRHGADWIYPDLG